ncbi:MAG: TonB-dependent receptor [Woeseiaceae bacterium]
MTPYMKERHGMAVLLAAIVIAVTPAVAAAGETTIDYEALENLFGEPVTASATGSPKVESEVAATMIIITQEDIRRSGARDIPGVLRQVAGVDVLHTSYAHTDVAVRGYDSPNTPRLLVLVDGRQVYADYYGFTPWSTVPVELAAIRQIEVVKGPNSALFGFNAAGGVINIVTYDPVNDDVASASLSAGTQSLLQGSLVSTWHIGESAGVRLTAGYRKDDGYSTPLMPTEAGVRDGDGRNAVTLNAGVDVTDRVRIGLDASYNDVQQSEFNVLGILLRNNYETDSIAGHVAADTGLGLLQANVYSNRIHSKLVQDDVSPPFGDFENRVTVAQLQDITKLGTDVTMRLSAEYRNSSMSTTPIEGADVFYHVVALGGMLEWRLRPDLTLTGAAREDHWMLGRSGSIPPGYGLSNDDWDRARHVPSFNLSAVWQVSTADTLRVQLGRGVQLPSLSNLGGFVLPFGPFGYAGGTPFLDPIKVDNFEVSWDRALPGLAAKMRLGAFVGRSQDIVATSGGMRLDLGLVAVPFNAGDSRTRGVEASIEGALPADWHWQFSYKYQTIDDRFDTNVPREITLTDFEDTTPRHVAKAGAGWTGGRWSVDGFVYYQSSFAGFRSTDWTSGMAQLVPVPASTVLDVRVACALTERIDLEISGRNLTDTKRQTAGPEVEREFFVTLSSDFGRNP